MGKYIGAVALLLGLVAMTEAPRIFSGGWVLIFYVDALAWIAGAFITSTGFYASIGIFLGTLPLLSYSGLTSSQYLIAPFLSGTAFEWLLASAKLAAEK